MGIRCLMWLVARLIGLAVTDEELDGLELAIDEQAALWGLVDADAR